MRLVEVISRSDTARALPVASPDVSVERSVWDRLYGLPRGLSEAVQQALAPEPDARQASVAEFHAQLLDGHTPSRGLSREEVVPFPMPFEANQGAPQR